MFAKDARQPLASFYTYDKRWKDELGSKDGPEELEWYVKHLEPLGLGFRIRELAEGRRGG